MRATIVVPFHRNTMHLRACLSALRQSAPDCELIVAADAALEDYQPLIREFAATVVIVAGPAGPAVARNRAAAQAHGEFLVFVDADVVVAADAIAGMCDLLEADPTIAAVFGAYDRHPAAPNFISQFKNLSHAYVHEVANPAASTFWAGLGAVRAAAFERVGGFDERFVRPSIEDIDLGYRLTAAGYILRLDPAFRATHLKRWTLRSCIYTDVVARGVPWMQLILRSRAIANDLNTSVALRVSVALAYGTVLGLALITLSPWSGIVAIALLAAMVVVNADYYRWFARQRGWWFALCVVPMHLLHHLCNGVSLAAGIAMHLAHGVGIVLPGALPAAAWPAPLPPMAHHSPGSHSS